MHNWRQSSAALIVSVLLLLIWVAIHLESFVLSSATPLGDLRSWIPIFFGLTALGNILFARFTHVSKPPQIPGSAGNRQGRL